MSILLFGGYQISSDKIISQSKIYRFDISSNSFTCINKSIPHYRRYGQCFLIDGFIYLLGGVSERDKIVREIDRYNTNNGEWKTLSLLMPEEKGTCTVLFNRKFYVIGGMEKEGPLTRILVHSIDDDSDKWEEFTDKLLVGRSFGQAVVCQNSIYVLGGEGSALQKIAEVERHDRKRQDWVMVAGMKQGRSFFQVVSVGRFIYAIGSTCDNSMEKLDTTSGVWENCQPLPYEIDEMSLSVVGKHIFSFGGSDYTLDETHQRMKYCLRYDTELDKWEELPPMTLRVAGHCSQAI